MESLLLRKGQYSILSSELFFTTSLTLARDFFHFLRLSTINIFNGRSMVRIDYQVVIATWGLPWSSWSWWWGRRPDRTRWGMRGCTCKSVPTWLLWPRDCTESSDSDSEHSSCLPPSSSHVPSQSQWMNQNNCRDDLYYMYIHKTYKTYRLHELIIMCTHICKYFNVF